MRGPRWRSLLFVAADDRPRLAKIAARGADAVILDLEDAIPPDRKDAAREILPNSIAELAAQSLPVIVRINGEDWRTAIADLNVAVRPGVTAIMVPKVEDTARLIVISQMIDELSAATDISEKIGIVALIEGPAGLAAANAIAQVGGVIALALGSEDFSLALGVEPTPEALILPCKILALAAATQGLMALGLPVSIAGIGDMDSWHQGIDRARAIGITGALCIHPRQIEPANAGFAPTDLELATAERIVAAWASRGGRGAIQIDGKMVDRPVLLAARQMLARRASPRR